jgi:hypothetical protein
MDKHTPGPWEALHIDHRWHIRTADWINGPLGGPMGKAAIADLYEGDADSANARLIAAAPELLEALAQIVDAYDYKGIGVTLPKSSLVLARAAIAKAKGA